MIGGVGWYGLVGIYPDAWHWDKKETAFVSRRLGRIDDALTGSSVW